MKRISKRLLSLVLALMMVATLLPMGAIQVFADDITWTEVDTFDEFTAAVAAGGNIRLMADITSTAKVVITTTVVIDFNSFTYTSYNGAFDSFYIQGGTVTMKDLSETKDGGIYLVSSKDSAYQMIRNSGKLTIENGVYTMDNNHTSAPYVIYSWGTCIINGGTFTINCTSSGSGYVLNNTAKGKTTINGGSFYANGSGSGSVRTLYNQANEANGTLTVNGGTYTVKATGSGIAYGMTNGNYGKMYVNGGTISVTQEGTGVAYGLYTSANSKGNELVVKGGDISVTSVKTAYGIAVTSGSNVNLSVPADANTVTINATSSANSAYGIENRGITTLASDKLSVTATTQVNAAEDKYAYGVWNGRTVNISAGTFQGYVTGKDSTKAQGNGYCNSRITTTSNGTTTVVATGTGLISGGTFYGSAPSTRGTGIVITYSNDLEIGGNTIANGSAKALWVYRGTITVSGGTYNTEGDSYNFHVDTNGVATVTGGTFNTAGYRFLRNSGTLNISGGTFKCKADTFYGDGTYTITGGNFVGTAGVGAVDIYEYLDTTAYSQDYYGTVVTADKVDPRFEVTIGDTVTQYESRNEMLAAVNADTTGNAKIKLLTDVYYGIGINFTTSIDLDLNGKSWLQSNGCNILTSKIGTENTITKIHNGTVINHKESVPVCVEKGAIQLENLTVYGCSTMPVCYYAPDGTYSADNYIKNCNLITNRYYTFSYRTSSTAGQQNMNILIEDTNLINLYHTAGSGAQFFYAGSAATTGQYTLGKNVNMYAVADTTDLAHQSGKTAAETVVLPVAADGCAIHAREDAATYSNINAILAKIGSIAGFTEGQYVYLKASIWTTNPKFYRFSTEHTFNDGACACGESTVASIGDVKYTDLATALEAATDGQTVVLNGNVTTNSDLLVGTEIGLDLNGKILNAGSLTVFGDLTDGAVGGTALVKSDNLHVAGDSYLPVYDSASEGYRFYKYDLAELGNKNVSENAIKFGFRLNLDNEFGYYLLQDTNNKISLNSTISWSGEYTNTMNYTFKASTLSTLAKALADGKSNYAITLTITGTDVLGENGSVSFAPTVGTGCGLVVKGQGKSWTAGV